jgi:hypothetical protein
MAEAALHPNNNSATRLFYLRFIDIAHQVQMTSENLEQIKGRLQELLIHTEPPGSILHGSDYGTVDPNWA